MSDQDAVFVEAVAGAKRSAGDKPEGPHAVLGHFGSLKFAPEQAVADTVVGPHVGDSWPARKAIECLRWVIGIRKEDGAGLGVAKEVFLGAGLVRARSIDGELRWVRTSLMPSRRRDFGQAPEPVRQLPIDTAVDTAAERQRTQELAAIDARVDARLRYWGLIA